MLYKAVENRVKCCLWLKCILWINLRVGGEVYVMGFAVKDSRLFLSVI